MRNTTDATNGAGAADRSGVPEFDPVYNGVCVVKFCQLHVSTFLVPCCVVV